MIIIDTSEKSTKLPEVKDAVYDSTLEGRTGADFMISPLSMPIKTDVLLKKHIQAGALLIQRKSGNDLLASIPYRLYHSLALMKQWEAAQWQCVLLSTGLYLPDTITKMVNVVEPVFGASGKITYKSSQWSKLKYISLQSTLRHWTWYGGVYIPLCCDDEIPMWCHRTHDSLRAKLKANYIKQVWPDGPETFFENRKGNDSLQKPVIVTDWRAKFTIIVDGIGPSLVTNLRNYMLKNGMEDTLMKALSFSMSEEVTQVDGWGKGKMKAVREAMGQ